VFVDEINYIKNSNDCLSTSKWVFREVQVNDKSLGLQPLFVYIIIFWCALLDAKTTNKWLRGKSNHHIHTFSKKVINYVLGFK